jgi:hypothetical protein
MLITRRDTSECAMFYGKSAVRHIGSAVGREKVRGVMGSIFGGRKR